MEGAFRATTIMRAVNSALDNGWQENAVCRCSAATVWDAATGRVVGGDVVRIERWAADRVRGRLADAARGGRWCQHEVLFECLVVVLNGFDFPFPLADSGDAFGGCDCCGNGGDIRGLVADGRLSDVGVVFLAGFADGGVD